MSISRDADDRVTIGQILGAHGVKGVLKVRPLTDYPDRFFGMDQLVIERPGKGKKTLDVLRVSTHESKGTFLIAADGVNDRDTADLYRGWLITVAKDERVELPEGEYWLDSLIGLAVIEHESGKRLGVIEDIFPTGSNDVYQVRTEDGELRPIPAIEQVVRSIDVEAGVMSVTLLEGLWDRG